tara:strand:- start:6765 stop:8999 length:2235 start_codon:yes stop_codon:yes gene_type:complete
MKFYNSSSTENSSFRIATLSIYNALNIGDKISLEGSSVPETNRITTIIFKHTYGFSGVQKYEIGVTGRFPGIYPFVEASDNISPDSTTQVTITKIKKDGETIFIKPHLHTSSTYTNRSIKCWNSISEAWAIKPIYCTESNDNLSTVGEGSLGFLPRYYYADLALRICDTNLANSSRIKWYGFIERNHFGNLPKLGWYISNNTLSKPTGGFKTANVPSTAARINWNITTAASDDSEWVPGNYDMAHTLIYDENQESKILEIDGGSTATLYYFTVPSGHNVKFQAICKPEFNERISGSRLYCRIKDSDDDWVFAAEVHFEKGIKSSLSSVYTGEVEGDGAGSARQAFSISNGAWYSRITTSIRQNIDTYESINGFAPDVPSIALGNVGDSWKISCIANRRVFIANISIFENSDSKIYADRIMYSEIGKYDTFPSFNFIDIVKGDAEAYTCLMEFSDRLLAFKNNTLFIINISNPSPTSWFLEKTFKHKGVKNSEAAFRTEDGIVWVNEAGCWVYNGENIVNLITNKLDPIQTYSSSHEHSLSWLDFFKEDTIVGYSPKYQQVLILSNGDPNTVYCYDVRTSTWTLLSDTSDFFVANSKYSNFILDGLGDLYIMTTGGVIRKYSPQSVAKAAGVIKLITKFIDFELPNNLKKIYKVTITYKSNASQANPIKCRYIDKNGIFQNEDFSSNNFEANSLVDTSNKWQMISFIPSASLQCQSIQFKINPPSAGTLELNEIMIYYRAKKRVV